jgi:hypothetical protein
MGKKSVRLAADIPEGSALHEAIQREQAETGRNVADIIRGALVDRYQDAILEAAGIKVLHPTRSKE